MIYLVHKPNLQGIAGQEIIALPALEEGNEIIQPTKPHSLEPPKRTEVNDDEY